MIKEKSEQPTKEQVEKIESDLGDLGFEGESICASTDGVGGGKMITFYGLYRGSKPDYYFSVTEPVGNSDLKVSVRISKYDRTTTELFKGGIFEGFDFVKKLLKELNND